VFASALYLSGLVFSIVGTGLLDWRFKLAFSQNTKAALLTTLIPLIFFLLWDGAGIALGIFFRGPSAHLTGLVVAPELPIEELFFLFLLNYTSLNLFIVFKRIWGKK
jgi:lycopene cyclase domain-containing protein